MEKLSVLNERMEECNTTIDEILNHPVLKNITEYSVYMYISKFDGLGNKDSDFDIYIIANCIKQHTSAVCKIGNASCDIEYWPVKDVMKNIKNKLYCTDFSKLKLIKRIKTGVEIICNNFDLKNALNEIKELDINQYIMNYFKICSNSEYEDAIKMYKNEEYISCLSCCQRAIDFLLGSINARNGLAVCNIKWAPKLFIQNKGYNNEELLNEYLDTFIYKIINIDNIKGVTERMVLFLGNNISSNNLFSWE